MRCYRLEIIPEFLSHVGFVVDKVALKQNSFRYLGLLFPVLNAIFFSEIYKLFEE
jgi:hypothetical protein